MTVGILVTSQIASGMEQSIIVPNYGKKQVEVFHRLSTGAKGRADSWSLTDSNFQFPTTALSTVPVAIRLSPSDSTDIAVGKVTTLGVKLIKASAEAKVMNAFTTHADMVNELKSRLETGDRSLGGFLVDARFKGSEIDIQPIQSTTTSPTVRLVSAPAVSAPASNSTRLATVPDASWRKSYIDRKVVGNLSMFDLYDDALANDKNVLLVGHTGSGKTMSTLAWASLRGLPYYSFACSAGADESQLLGGMKPTADGHFQWVDGVLTEMFREGGVFVIDELNMMSERLSAKLHPCTDGRRELTLNDKDGEVIKAHPNLLIVGAMNPEYRGTRPLNQAWADRFEHRIEFGYDDAIERKLIKNRAVLDLAKKLRYSFDVDKVITTPISTRALVSFTETIDRLGLDYAMYSFINKFAKTEQAQVKMILDTFRSNIERNTNAPANTNTESETI